MSILLKILQFQFVGNNTLSHSLITLLTYLLCRTAPEVFKTGQYTTKSDVWSFGVVMWEIFERGEIPYGGLSPKDVIEEVKSGNTLKKPSNCSDEVFEIMTECWNQVYSQSFAHVNNTSSFRIVHCALLLALWCNDSQHSQQQMMKSPIDLLSSHN
jgi:serine/threonine protein kinase